MTSRLAFDFTAPGKLLAKTCAVTWLQRLFPLSILLWHIGLVLHLKNMKLLSRHGIHIPVFTVWKYLVHGIYQRGDLKLKSVFRGPLSIVIFTIAIHFQGPNKHPEALMPAHDCRYLQNTTPSQSLVALLQTQGIKASLWLWLLHQP